MIREILLIVLMLFSVPVGLLISYLARDELKSGRKYFRLLIILSIVAGIVFVKEISIALSCLFIIITAAISLHKSYDRKWTQIR